MKCRVIKLQVKIERVRYMQLKADYLQICFSKKLGNKFYLILKNKKSIKTQNSKNKLRYNWRKK